jgi:hypothetical protein
VGAGAVEHLVFREGVVLDAQDAGDLVMIERLRTGEVEFLAGERPAESFGGDAAMSRTERKLIRASAAARKMGFPGRKFSMKKFGRRMVYGIPDAVTLCSTTRSGACSLRSTPKAERKTTWRTPASFAAATTGESLAGAAGSSGGETRNSPAAPSRAGRNVDGSS